MGCERVWVGVLAAITLCAGCDPGSAIRQSPEGVYPAPVWPGPPAEPRIRWVRSVATPADWGITKGTFARLLDALSGESQVNFIRPTGVVERDGALYIADPGAQALWILDARRNRFERITRIGESTLVSPVAVALGPSDSVFVADSWRKQIFVLDRGGRLIRTIENERFLRPAAVAFDAATGQLYVADSTAQRIWVLGPDGRLVRSLGASGSRESEFNFPTHLAIDAQGTLLVTDALNFRIQAFGRDGGFLWMLGRAGDGSGDFAAPKGLATDSRGNVYVVDALFDAVQVFDREGTLLLAFGERGTRVGQFWLPGGLFIGPGDRIYVADAYNQRIQVFRAVGASQAEAGRK